MTRPKFERRHYVAVAATIKDSPVYTGGSTHQTMLSVQQMECLIEKFCDMFEADNPNFQPARFRQACGGEPAYEVTIEGKAELLKTGAA